MDFQKRFSGFERGKNIKDARTETKRE